MKLGEALTLRAFQAQKLAELRMRAIRSAVTQEGDSPVEDPAKALDEFEKLSREQAKLISRINVTNQTATTGAGETLAEWLQKREHLRRLKNAVGSLIDASATDRMRYMRTEIKLVTNVDVSALQKQFDDLTEQIRRIDATIQTENWKHELL